MVIVTGAEPQLNVMIPPAATALTSADDVQLDGVPVPITWFGWLVSTGRAAAGIVACPFGLPARNAGDFAVLGDDDGLAVGVGAAVTLGTVATCGDPDSNWVRVPDEHAASAAPTSATPAATLAIFAAMLGAEWGVWRTRAL
jgi:hypothetical protein